MKHKMLSAEFLENNYERVFTSYQRLLNSENYVTRRQALKVGVRWRVDFQLFIVKYHLYLSNSFTRRNDLQKVMVLRDKCFTGLLLNPNIQMIMIYKIEFHMMYHCYLAGILPIRHKTQDNQSIQ